MHIYTFSCNCCPFQVEGTITSPYHWPSEGIVTLKNVKLRFPIKSSDRLINMQPISSGIKITCLGRLIPSVFRQKPERRSL